MIRAYEDIRSRLGEPLWWDEQGVPRYDAFRPDMLGVYEKWACLYLIACQACGQRFNVAASWGRLVTPCSHHVEFRKDVTTEEVAGLHFGDPPIHGCSGDTMNCEDLRVLEFWKQANFEWVRVPEMEVPLADCQPAVPSLSDGEEKR